MAKRNKNICTACGTHFADHLGLQPTCTALYTAKQTLQDITTMRGNKEAKFHALATLQFIDSQTKNPKGHIHA